MAYVINRFNGEQLIVLEDGTLDTSTSIGLVGRNYNGYGEIQNENFLFLLENFSNEFPPSAPLDGQLWYDSNIEALKLYNNRTWIRVSGVDASETPPDEIEGTLWFDTLLEQLKIFSNGWKSIGPESVRGFDETKATSRVLTDTLGTTHAVIEIKINGVSIAIVSSEEFTIANTNAISGFNLLKRGINLSNIVDLEDSVYQIIGNLNGVSSSALKLENSRTINGVIFDGQNNIIITANTPNTLKKGEYIIGSNFNGSNETTWNINASPNNLLGTIVARDSTGSFKASIISADLVGNVTGNITSTSGTSTFDKIVANQIVGATLSGNALTASRLERSVSINGINFDGSRDITITASASTLTGTVLSSTVKNSSLESTGVLTNLKIKDAGILVGDNDELKFSVDISTRNSKILSQAGNKELILSVRDPSQPNQEAKFRFLPSAVALNLGGTSHPSFVPETSGAANLGTSSLKWNDVWSNKYNSVAADLAENYRADSVYEHGTVVMFGGEAEVTMADDETVKVAGVISEQPAYTMNVSLESTYVATVALQGRVKCKVKGRVSKGDMLISAGNGYAKSCQNPKIGQVIGKSLEDTTDHESFIEVVVGRV